MAIWRLVSIGIGFLAVAQWSGAAAQAQVSAPWQRFNSGDTITVKLWWESFKDPCLPYGSCLNICEGTTNACSNPGGACSDGNACVPAGYADPDLEMWRSALMAGIEDIIDRLGIDIGVQYGGLIEGPCAPGVPCPACQNEACETPPIGSKELWINMDFGNGSSAATKTSWGMLTPQAGKIEFKRFWIQNTTPTGTLPIAWKSNFTEGGDIFRIVRHHMMRVLGFQTNWGWQHTTNSTNRVGYLAGPSMAERDAALQTYQPSLRRLARVQSTDDGDTWSSQPTNLTNLGVYPYGRFGVVQDDNLSMICYSSFPGRIPTFMHGTPNLDTFDITTQTPLAGQRARDGVDCDGRIGGYGNNGGYMMTYVDGLNEYRRVRVLFSTDGFNWVDRTPAEQFSVLGDPAIAQVVGLSSALPTNCWVLAYAKSSTLSWDTEQGTVAARRTCDNGSTWEPEYELTDNYRTHRGVDIANATTLFRVLVPGAVDFTSGVGRSDYGNTRRASIWAGPAGLGGGGMREWELPFESYGLTGVSASASIGRANGAWISAHSFRSHPLASARLNTFTSGTAAFNADTWVNSQALPRGFAGFTVVANRGSSTANILYRMSQ